MPSAGRSRRGTVVLDAIADSLPPGGRGEYPPPEPSPTRGEGSCLPRLFPTRGEGNKRPPPQPSPTRGEGNKRLPPKPFPTGGEGDVDRRHLYQHRCGFAGAVGATPSGPARSRRGKPRRCRKTLAYHPRGNAAIPPRPHRTGRTVSAPRTLVRVGTTPRRIASACSRRCRCVASPDAPGPPRLRRCPATAR